MATHCQIDSVPEPAEELAGCLAPLGSLLPCGDHNHSLFPLGPTTGQEARHSREGGGLPETAETIQAQYAAPLAVQAADLGEEAPPTDEAMAESRHPFEVEDLGFQTLERWCFLELGRREQRPIRSSMIEAKERPG